MCHTRAWHTIFYRKTLGKRKCIFVKRVLRLRLANIYCFIYLPLAPARFRFKGGHFNGVGFIGGPRAERTDRLRTFENLQIGVPKIEKNY